MSCNQGPDRRRDSIGARNREPIIEELVAGGNAVGVFDQSPSSPAEPNRVVANFDDVRTARSAIDYLASLGHTDIAVIHGDRRRNAGAMKHRGFLAGPARSRPAHPP